MKNLQLHEMECPRCTRCMEEREKNISHWSKCWSNDLNKSSWNPLELDYFGRSLTQTFLSFIDEKDQTFLEAGCGMARASFSIAIKKKNAYILAIDLSDIALERVKSLAKKAKLNNLFVEKCDIFKTNLPSDCFDVTYNFGTIEHYSTPQPIIAEMIRVTRHGGKIIIGTPNILSAYNSITSPFRLLWLSGRKSSENQLLDIPYTKYSLMSLLEEMGLQSLKATCTGSLAQISWIFPKMARMVEKGVPSFIDRFFGYESVVIGIKQ